ncbi:flagellar biosynthesis anti-sigma factor FlgM [Roseateles sp. BYS180W]|uniref:Negative regulator of flagellin synthesis n=1 Tax=Roseateles rivi TaxID=3299028 RepID=A0ABW7FUY3_9BURK
MKIGHNPELQAYKQATAERTTQGAQGKSAAPAGAKAAEGTQSAQVALSPQASELLAGGRDESSFDAEKVKRISQAIADGKFTVNAEAIADKLLANVQEMLARSGSGSTTSSGQSH